MSEFSKTTPPPARDLPTPRLQLLKETLMKEVRQERKRPTYRQKRWRIGAILVPAVLLTIAAGGYALLESDEAVAAGIGCFETAELDGNVTVLQTTGQDPVAVCEEQWEMGNLGAQGPVPEMTACINEAGAVYVLPSADPDICTQLGLQDLPTDYVAEARRFASMRDDLIEAIKNKAAKNGNCLDPRTSSSIAEDVIAKHGLDEWRVEVLSGDGYEGRRCANWLGFDDKTKTVQIIPSDATL